MRVVFLTQLMWQFMAEDGERCGQTGLPGQGESRTHCQAVRKVMYPITKSYQIR